MTCIVGIVDKEAGSVVLAADSLWLYDGQRISYANDPKVWRADRWLLGFSGSRACQPFLQRTPLPNSGDVDDDVFEWTKTARHATGKYTYTLDGDDKAGWTVLVATGVRLWLASGSGAVCDFTKRGFMAIGSGAPYALGALSVTQAGTKLSAESAAQLAVETACHHDAGSGLPVSCARTTS